MPQQDPYAAIAKPLDDPYATIATPLASAAPVSQHPVLNAVSNFGKGVLKSGVATMSSADDLAAKYLPAFMTTPIGQTATPENSAKAVQAAKTMATPNGTAQSVGKTVGNIAQFLAPTGVEEAGAQAGAALGSRLAGKLGGAALNTGVINKAQGGSFGAGAAGGAIGGAIGEALPALKTTMQDNAVGRINKVVGALKSDFSRGANPGQGYLGANLGISSSMRSIADKSAEALDSTGGRIGNALDNGTASGVKIVPLDAARGIAEPINQAHAILSGPGGGSPAALEDLSESFRPTLQSAAKNGGISPRDYFNAKLNVAKNTSWGDPMNVGIKQVRQQIVGGMGGVLKDAVPELGDEFSQYQDLTKLANRAADRADTGRPSLSGVGKTLIHAGSVLGGGAVGGVPGMALGAVPGILDSVPVQTALATGLYRGGAALGSGIAKPLGRLGPALVLGRNR